MCILWFTLFSGISVVLVRFDKFEIANSSLMNVQGWCVTAAHKHSFPYNRICIIVALWLKGVGLCGGELPGAPRGYESHTLAFILTCVSVRPLFITAIYYLRGTKSVHFHSTISFGFYGVHSPEARPEFCPLSPIGPGVVNQIMKWTEIRNGPVRLWAVCLLSFWPSP